MKYTNGTFTGTHKDIKAHLGASIPRNHPENWPEGPWTAVVPEPVEPSIEQRIRTARDAAMYAGTTLNGMEIATDERSQSRITGAAVAALQDSEYTLNWKTSDGFVQLDAAQILDVAHAVRVHVQACYDREAELSAMENPTDADINSGWPT